MINAQSSISKHTNIPSVSNPPLQRRAKSTHNHLFDSLRKARTIDDSVPLWTTKISFGKTPDKPIINSVAMIDTGCSSILIDSILLSNQMAINKFDIITDDTLKLSSAFQDDKSDIKGYLYAYLTLYDTEGRPYHLHAKVFIAQGLSYPVFLGLNVFTDQRFHSLVPTGFYMKDDSTYGKTILRHIPFLPPGYSSRTKPLRNTHSVVLRANSDTLIETDYEPLQNEQQVAVYATEIYEQGQKFEDLHNFNIFESVYPIKENGKLKIVLQNNTFDDIFIAPYTNIATVQDLSNEIPLYMDLEVNHVQRFVQPTLSSDITCSLLRMYNSLTDEPSEYKKRKEQIMKELNDNGIASYKPTHLFAEVDSRRSVGIDTLDGVPPTKYPTLPHAPRAGAGYLPPRIHPRNGAGLEALRPERPEALAPAREEVWRFNFGQNLPREVDQVPLDTPLLDIKRPQTHRALPGRLEMNRGLAGPRPPAAAATAASQETPLKGSETLSKESFDLRHLSPKQVNLFMKLAKHYESIFLEDLSKLTHTHLVEMSADLRPNIDLSHYAIKHRDIPLAGRDQLEKILQQMLKSNLIVKANEPVRLISPIRVIPKKTPGKWRMISDVRLANAVSQKAADPGNETIMNSLSQLSNCVACTSIDLTHSFFQVRVDKYLQSLLSFYGPGRVLYQNVVSPMGYINSSMALHAAVARMKSIPVFRSELSDLFPKHPYNLGPRYSVQQAHEVRLPVKTQVVGTLSDKPIRSNIPKTKVYHTNLSVKDILNTYPVDFHGKTLLKSYADDISIYTRSLDDIVTCNSAHMHVNKSCLSPSLREHLHTFGALCSCTWSKSAASHPDFTLSHATQKKYVASNTVVHSAQRASSQPCSVPPTSCWQPSSDVPSASNNQLPVAPKKAKPNPYITDTSQAVSDDLFNFHLAELELLFLKLKKGNLKISASKLNLCVTSIPILGFTWSLNKLSIPENRLQGFKALKVPTTKSECRSLLGAYSFFRAFIPNFAKISKPINDLAHSKKSFEWTSIHQSAMDKLYSTVKKHSTLDLYDSSQPLHLYTDASSDTIAGFIAQPTTNNSGLKVLFNFSRILTPAEANSSSFRKEILAILYGLRSYEFLLKGAKEVVLFCDVKSILWMKYASASDPYVYRLSSDLSEFGITKIVSVPTVLHAPCDYLSRMNKHSVKINELLGPEEPLSVHEAECLVKRIHVKRLTEFTGEKLKDLLTPTTLPSILLKKTLDDKKRKQHLASKPNIKTKPQTIKPRNIRAPVLKDKSVITTDSPFMLYKYQKQQRQAIKKQISKAKSQLHNLQKDLFHLDHGNARVKPLKSNSISILEVNNSTPKRRSARLLNKKLGNEGMPQSTSNETTSNKNHNGKNLLLETSPPLSLPPTAQSVNHKHTKTNINGPKLPKIEVKENHYKNFPRPTSHDGTNEQNRKLANDSINSSSRNCTTENFTLNSQENLSPPSFSQISKDPSYIDLHVNDKQSDSELEFSVSQLLFNAKVMKNGLITVQQFLQEQSNDSYCKKILNNLHLYPKFSKQKDFLCYFDNKDKQFKLVLPFSFIETLFNSFHFSSLHGHMNSNTLYRFLASKYYHPKLKQTIVKYTSTCAICALYSTRPLKDIEIGKEIVCNPRLRWVADLFHISSPFGKQLDFSFVLVCVDSYSQYAQLFPLKNKSTEAIYEAILKLITAFGAFSSLKADSESSIGSAEMKSKLTSLNIHISQSASGHSRSQSLAERTIASAKQAFRKLLRDNHDLSVLELTTLISNQINTSVNALGISPEKLMFMITLPSQHDLLQFYDDFSNNPNLYKAVKSHLSSIVQKRQQIRDELRDKKNRTRRAVPIFEPGQIVFVSQKNLIKSHTGLRCKFSGPHMVVASNSNHSYVLHNLANGSIIKRSAEFLLPAINPFTKSLLSQQWDAQIRIN